MKKLIRGNGIIFILIMILVSCSKQDNGITGVYRGILHSSGGPLAFPIHITGNENRLGGFVINGNDTLHFTSVSRNGDSLHMNFSYYDSHLDARIGKNGNLSGRWHRRSSVKDFGLPFTAEKGVTYRYPKSASSTDVFNGQWPTIFTESDGHTYPATGEFHTSDGHLSGTFLTESGDFRYLEGTYTDSTLTLSTFDGSHAYLIKARLQPDGSLKGDSWYANTDHSTWTAHRGSNQLRNPFAINKIDPSHPNIEFSLPDINGHIVNAGDPEFKNKPIMLYIFGTWCPNCSDEAAMIRKMYDKYHAKGVAFIGVSYEYSGNFKNDVEMIRRYKKRFNIPWTLLYGGKASAEVVEKTLPFLDKLYSYPTTFFANSKHHIVAIHAGFSGPGTGKYYTQEKQAFTEKLDSISK